MKRVVLAIILGTSLTFGLFLVMVLMVKNNSTSTLSQNDDRSTMNFIRVKRAEHLDVRERKKPELPKTPEVKPQMPQMNVAQSPLSEAPVVEGLNIPTFDLPLNISGGSGPSLMAGAMAPSQNSDIIPIVRMEPVYPRQAAMAGIEGWVQVAFDVSENGSVENISILDSQPKKVFDRATIQGLLKWKFKPKVINGVAVKQTNIRQQIDFNLGGS